MKCTKSDHSHQPFPHVGVLASTKNLQLDALRRRIPSGNATVYLYVIDTIKNRDWTFIQTGSGPNFQGNLVTLCTCKHYMRTFLDPDAWKGKWIAGFTGIGAGEGGNFLVYLIQVSHTFRSHYDFWFTEAFSMETKQAKAAHLNKFGDIYKPESETGNPFDPRSYIPPVENHVHKRDDHWHKDIDYVGCSGREAALLAGDPEYSFTWDRHMIFLPSKLHRGQKKSELADLLSQLKVGRIL